MDDSIVDGARDDVDSRWRRPDESPCTDMSGLASAGLQSWERFY
jgi:hypothetical protein